MLVGYKILWGPCPAAWDQEDLCFLAKMGYARYQCGKTTPQRGYKDPGKHYSVDEYNNDGIQFTNEGSYQGE